MKLTPRLGQALTLAIEAHEGQMRKGTNIPYISHPIAVASIALEHGADEDQAIAALLHDAIEDGGANYENRIRVQFGDRVVGIGACAKRRPTYVDCIGTVVDSFHANLCIARGS